MSQSDGHEYSRGKGFNGLVVSRQTWQDLTFLHWQVPVDLVSKMLPPGLEVDTFQGKTWVSVVPFVMAEVRTTPLPQRLKHPHFHELNVRVYVVDRQGNQGVWFVKIWCSSLAFTFEGRAVGLPYSHMIGSSAVSQRTADYVFERSTDPLPMTFRATLEESEEATLRDSPLEEWLTARWNMFAIRFGRVWRFPVEHEPWDLRPARATSLSLDLPGGLSRLNKHQPDLIHLAKPVHTRVFFPRRV
ncbi:DUF2071 domain-containing protein [Lysinibacter sp. HNR]|uniref:YqjF family protein n=1 Tax=Lysinibacter sp. HNR TaxID=3031408 RepID=UPI002435C27F|nr:DUF2071 domain-containing protein [Lysinibacter sp. HNR]WGD36915.1 DUF2071 domain-containing protein [Lysinibacter sp. HNR]